MHAEPTEGAVLGGWNMKVQEDDAIERVARELLHPLAVIQLNAEELLQQFQEEREDPTAAGAAQALLRSVERMSHIVQVLRQCNPSAQAASEGEEPPGEPCA